MEQLYFHNHLGTRSERGETNRSDVPLLARARTQSSTEGRGSLRAIFVSAVHVGKAKEAVFGKKTHTIKMFADAKVSGCMRKNMCHVSTYPPPQFRFIQIRKQGSLYLLL